jgi:hypothetical protein
VKRIRVKLLNGREGMFPYYVLDHYIKKKAIVAFERSDGWVDISKDPVRKAPASLAFNGRKKRFTDFVVKKRVTDKLL